MTRLVQFAPEGAKLISGNVTEGVSTDDLLILGGVTLAVLALGSSNRKPVVRPVATQPPVTDAEILAPLVKNINAAIDTVVDSVRARADLLPGGVLPAFDPQRLGKISDRRSHFVTLPAEYTAVSGNLRALSTAVEHAAFVFTELALRGYQFACPAHIFVSEEGGANTAPWFLDRNDREAQDIGTSALDVLAYLSAMYLDAAFQATVEAADWQRTVTDRADTVRNLLAAVDLEVAMQAAAGAVGSPESLATAWAKVAANSGPLSILGTIKYQGSNYRLRDGVPSAYPMWWTGPSERQRRYALEALRRSAGGAQELENALGSLAEQLTNSAPILGHEASLTERVFSAVKDGLRMKRAGNGNYASVVETLRQGGLAPANPTPEQVTEATAVGTAVLNFLNTVQY